MGIRKRTLKFSGIAALLSAFCLLIGTAATGQAATANKGPAQLSAELPYGMTAAEYNYQQEQSPLDEMATKIEALAAKSGAASDGFFDTQVLPPQHTLIVYWHGAMPAAVSHLIAQSQGAMNIRVVQTRYSLAVLSHQEQLAMGVPGAASAYLQTDGSGIVLGVSAGRLRSAQAALPAQVTAPVTITNAGTDEPQGCILVPGDTRPPASRCDDQSPFWGGDVITQFSIPGAIAACTGGFGVHNSSGHQYMMTAAHCAYNGSAYVNGITFHNGWDNATLGVISDVPGAHDGAIISTRTGNRYYDGPSISNGDTSNTKLVAGYQTVSVGDSLCESGAFGGVKCGSIVKQLNFSDGTFNSMALATTLNGSVTIDGDSGGPWFSLDGSTHVWAKGIHHGLYANSSAVYEMFTPISIILHDTGTSVNTG